jgi:biopolymer transport protein ExbD
MGYKKRNKASADFNMSSLTDIVFLLLIFFMLTSNVVSPSAINLMLPRSSRSAVSKPEKDEQISLKIDKNKKILFQGSEVDLNTLRVRFEAELKKKGGNPKDVFVILDVDEEVDAQTLVSVVDVLNAYEAKMILKTNLSEND